MTYFIPFKLALRSSGEACLDIIEVVKTSVFPRSRKRKNGETRLRVSYTDCETAGTEPLSLELRVRSTVDVRGVPGSNPGKINEVLSS